MHPFVGYISHPKRDLCIWRMWVPKVIIHYPNDHGYQLPWFSEFIALKVKAKPLAFGKGSRILAHFVGKEFSRHAPYKGRAFFVYPSAVCERKILFRGQVEDLQ